MFTSYIRSSQLRLVFNVGYDAESGKTHYKTKSFSNIRASATADELVETAQAFSKLQAYTLSTIARNDVSHIIKEG